MTETTDPPEARERPSEALVGGPTVLVFDAANHQCAVAIAQGGVLAARAEPGERGQADRLFPMIDNVLQEAQVEWDGVDGIATIVGPGSFAGVRVGVAAARSLSLALERPAIGVDGFEAYAAAALRQGCGAETLAVVFGKPPRLLWRYFRLAEPIDAIVKQPDAALITGDVETLIEAVSGSDDLVVVGPAIDRLPTALTATVGAEALLGAVAAIAVKEMGAMRATGCPIPAPKPIHARPPDASPSSTPPPPRLPLTKTAFDTSA